MTTRRALVTGGSGFLGRELVPALLARYDVVDIVDLRPAVGAPAGTVHLGDVRDLLPALPRYDAVFHLAATVGGRAGLEDGPLGVASNLAVDLAFFDYVARTRPASAAYLSSSAVYPAQHDTAEDGGPRPWAEASADTAAAVIGRPDGTYGWVKLTGEHVANVVSTRFGVPVVCYRPFTVYGPEQGPEYPVPAIVARAVAREDPLGVWGSGEQARDLVHVEDVIAAIVATHDRVPGGALNVCSGVATSFRQIARAAADAVGYHPEIVGDLSRPGGVDFRVGCPARLGQWATLGTTPADGIARLVGRLTSP